MGHNAPILLACVRRVLTADSVCFASSRPYKQIFNLQPVEIRNYDDPKQQFAAEIAALGRPVVVRSAMLRSKWKAIGKWSNAFMVSSLCPGSTMYPVFVTKNHTFWLHRSHNEIYSTTIKTKYRRFSILLIFVVLFRVIQIGIALQHLTSARTCLW